MHKVKVGNMIKNLRKAKNYTTVELANKVNVSQAYISRLENDKIIPNIDMLGRILNALGTDLAAFFTYAYRDNTPSEDLIVLYENLRTLKPEVRTKIIELIDVINS